MSLWAKPLSEIQFSDIDDFCNARYSEGLQLDYKRDIPKDLAKTVAAFANTRGGLLLFGVEASQVDNKPVWPCDGMAKEPGLSERIMQICRDNIYPPIMPEISSPIENPSDASKVFMVVRIDESARAPHSIRNGTKVYVRTGDTNNPIDLAHIDKIAFLLDRRKDAEAFRESLLTRYFTRYEDNVPKGDGPCFWLSLIPEYPEEQVFQYGACRLAVPGGQAHRVHEGFLSLVADAQECFLAGAGKHGDIFYARRFPRQFSVSSEEIILPVYLCNLVLSFLSHCQSAYSGDTETHVGLLRFAGGGLNVKGLVLGQGGPLIRTREPFLDGSVRIDRTTSLQEIADEDLRFDLAFSFMAELLHGFGISQPPNRSCWQLIDF